MTDQPVKAPRDLHDQAVELLARRLPEGLPHPYDPEQLLTFPGLKSNNLPNELAAAHQKMCRLLCEVIVSTIEDDLDVELMRRRPIGRYVLEITGDGAIISPLKDTKNT